MKILMLSLEYSPGLSGGVGTHVQELSAGLARSGDSVTVLSGTTGKHQCLAEGRKDVHLVPPDSGENNGMSIAQNILRYNRKLVSYADAEVLGKSSRPNLIHCHNWTTYPAAAALSDLTGAPVLTTVHYLSYPIEAWWGQEPDPEIVAEERKMLRQGSTFIAVSEAIRDLMRDVYSIPETVVSVIYNALDFTSFLQESEATDLRDRLRRAVAPSDETIILYTGRLHPMKGIAALLRSASIVLSKEPNVRYLLAGEPDSQAFAIEFRRLLEGDQVLKNKVTVLGKVNRKHVAALYSVADMAVLPSVFDPCPYAAIEAMAAGLPLIASNGGGLAELLTDGVSGVTVPVHIYSGSLRGVDPTEFAEATLKLVRNRDLATRLGNEARKRATESYRTEVMVGATQSVYRHVLSKETAGITTGR